MKRLTRRGILGLFGGGVASAASGISPAQAAEHLGVSLNEPTGLLDGEHAPVGVAPFSSDMRPFQLLHRARENRYRPPGGLPDHIASKKSWSGAFKDHVDRQERAVLHMLEDCLDRDDQFRARFAELLGVGQ